MQFRRSCRRSRLRSGRWRADVLSRVGKHIYIPRLGVHGPARARQRLIIFFGVDVSDIAVLLIAIVEEDRTVEVVIVIVVRLG